MAARRILLVDDEEDTHCTARAQFLRANREVLGDQMDLELFLHFPDKRLPPKLRGLPAPKPTPVVTPIPPVRTGPPQPRAARRGVWQSDIAKLRANDDT